MKYWVMLEHPDKRQGDPGRQHCHCRRQDNVTLQSGLLLQVLSFNVVSAVVAGVGLFLLAASLKALKTATEVCGSERDPLASLSNVLSISHTALRAKDCLLAGSSLTVSRLGWTRNHLEDD